MGSRFRGSDGIYNKKSVITWHFCKSPNQACRPHRTSTGWQWASTLAPPIRWSPSVRSGIPEVLSDEEGRQLLPSIVRYLPNGNAHIGHKARPHQTTDPRNTVVSVKRFMGRGLKDIAYAENLPYDFQDTPGMVQLKTVAGVKSPVEISAQILATLRQIAEDSLGDELVGAVITVPAYFDDAQRQATKDAAQLAGLNVLRLLSEPTAAAIAYGLDQGSEGVYAVYDLGGGTFDISILKLSKGVFEVLSTGGDSALGGDDFDHRLFCWIVEQAAPGPAVGRRHRHPDGQGAPGQGTAVDQPRNDN